MTKDIKFILVGVEKNNELVFDKLRDLLGKDIHYLSVSHNVDMLQDHVDNLKEAPE